MKRNFLIGILIVVTVLACACADTRVTPTAIPTSTSTPTPTATSTPTPTPTSTPTPTPTQTPKEALLESLTESTQNALYESDKLCFSEKYSAELFCIDGTPIILYRDYGTEGDRVVSYIEAYDKNFEPKMTVELAYYSTDVEVTAASDDLLSVMSRYDNKVWLFNSELEVVAEISIPYEHNSYVYCYDTENNKMYYAGTDKTIFCYDYKTGECNEFLTVEYEGFDSFATLQIPQKGELWASAFMYDEDSFGYKTYIYSLEDVSLIKDLDEKVEEYYAAPGKDRYVVGTSDPYYRIEIRNADDSLIATVNYTDPAETSSFYVDWDNELLITYICLGYTKRVKEFRAYSLADGKLVATCPMKISDSDYSSPIIDFETGTLCFLAYGEDAAFDGCQKVYYWDYVNDGVEDSTGVYRRINNISETFSKKIELLRNKLQDTYGIYIYLGYEAIGLDLDYYVDICDNEDKIYETLELLDLALQKYPDGFFDQLKAMSFRTLGLYLADGIHSSDSNRSDAIGLAASMSYERILILDVNSQYELEPTIYHEISHWIDKYINDKEKRGEEFDFDFEEGFQALNPIDDYYAFSYTDYGEYYTYTYYYGDDKNEVYSIDSYGRTYPTEDRARMFEKLMVQDRNLYLCPHLLQKYEYYFRAIRRSFDTTGWPEKTAWELAFEDLIKRYESEVGEYESLEKPETQVQN